MRSGPLTVSQRRLMKRGKAALDICSAAGGSVPDGGAVEQTSFGPRPPMPALTSFDRLGPDGNGRELHGDDRLG